MAVANRCGTAGRYREQMSANHRPLHSVPTGPDVTAGSGPQERQADIDPNEPTDTQALMQRIDRSGAAERERAPDDPKETPAEP